MILFGLISSILTYSNMDATVHRKNSLLLGVADHE